MQKSWPIGWQINYLPKPGFIMWNFIRENKLISALFIISFIVILFGVALVIYSNQQAVNRAKEQAQVETLSKIALEAETQLLQTVVHPDVPITDVIPEDSLSKVSAMENKNPEPGTADWCEVMMVKPSKEWSTDEQQIFAKNCI
jgi:ABC-type lipoprotein release transport system permease subunit